MKLLIIICAHELDSKWRNNIKILDDYMKCLNIEVYYCGISNQSDFHNYESIIQFKHKIINTKRQFNKLCDFITDYKHELYYDWYMKIRPDLKLLENINFDILSQTAINGRARVYRGPKKIKYGTTVNGQGRWKHISGYHYDEKENIVLDDMLFIFHNNIIQMNAFDKILHESMYGEEWAQTHIYNIRNIPLNVIGIHIENTKYNTFSGDIGIIT